MSLKLKSPSFSRRTFVATASAITLSAAASNRALAQTSTPVTSVTPDAATSWTATSPTPPPPLRFTNEQGKSLSLEDYKGRLLLVNLWATWCEYCRDEMPTFVALAPKLKAFNGLILPISVDKTGLTAVAPYYKANNITDLPMLADTTGQAMQMMQTQGIPTTLVVRPDGMSVARMEGSADWDTPAVLAFLEKLAHAPSHGTMT